jgi:hypothetical protein
MVRVEKAATSVPAEGLTNPCPVSSSSFSNDHDSPDYLSEKPKTTPIIVILEPICNSSVVIRYLKTRLAV